MKQKKNKDYCSRKYLMPNYTPNGNNPIQSLASGWNSFLNSGVNN